MTGLGRVPDAYPHWTTLRPFLSRLLRNGEQRGEIVLIDEGTGAVVARHFVRAG